jgi:sarcosine oxidase
VNYGYDRVPDPHRLDRSVDDGLLTVIRDAVAGQLPGLYPEPVRVGAYMDGYTSDHHALVGPARELPRTFLACGFSGHGFKMSPAIGAAVADLVVDGHTDLPIGHLAAGRPLADETPDDLRTVAGDLSRAVVDG